MFANKIPKTVGIPKSDLERLTELAKAQKISVSRLIRLAITIYLDNLNNLNPANSNEDSKN